MINAMKWNYIMPRKLIIGGPFMNITRVYILKRLSTGKKEWIEQIGHR
jgi:hypothetical protein